MSEWEQDEPTISLEENIPMEDRYDLSLNSIMMNADGHMVAFFNSLLDQMKLYGKE